MYRIYLKSDFDFTLLKEPPLVCISDIDETYLRTDFRSLRGLAVTAMQLAVDRIVYPGMSAFFRALKSNPRWALYFISSSPVQLRAVMRRKFTLEEIPFDGLVLRDTLHMALTGRAGEIRNPFGYKLYALLSLSALFPAGTRIILLGDDTESDADVYETMRALAAGALGRAELERILYARGIHAGHAAGVLRSAGGVEGRSLEVAAIFIRKTSGDDRAEQPGARKDVTFFTHPSQIMRALLERSIIGADQHDLFTRERP